jgi:hypothetical protein
MPRFPETFCSACGGAFGPGDSGFSHCDEHKAMMSDEAFFRIADSFSRAFARCAKGETIPSPDMLDDIEMIFDNWMAHARMRNADVTLTHGGPTMKKPERTFRVIEGGAS